MRREFAADSSSARPPPVSAPLQSTSPPSRRRCVKPPSSRFRTGGGCPARPPPLEGPPNTRPRRSGGRPPSSFSSPCRILPLDAERGADRVIRSIPSAPGQPVQLESRAERYPKGRRIRKGKFSCTAFTTYLTYTPEMILSSALRRGAGVVERGGLENRCTLTGTQGSNPCLSAIFGI